MQLRDGARVRRRFGVRRDVPLVPLLLIAILSACGSSARGATPSTSAVSSGQPTAASPSDRAPTPSASEEVSNGDLAWSRAAEAHHGTPTGASIVVRDADGRDRVVASDAAYRIAPAWSPDGRSLVFVGNGALMVLRDGGPPEALMTCDPPSCLGISPPAWSPDGTTIAFGMSGARVDALAVVDVREGRAEILAQTMVVGAPAWSPDGATIAVIVGDAIELIDARDGRGAGSLDVEGRVGDGLAWSPDGETFAVEATVEGIAGIYLLPVDGGAPALLTACRDDGCTDLDPVWSPDGRSVAFTRASCDVPGGDCFTGDLFVMDADGGTPQLLVGGASLDCCAAWQSLPASP